MLFNPVSGTMLNPGGDDSELILGYEKRIQDMMMTLQKQERETLFKDEEIKSIKKIAGDVAEELELTKKREESYRAEILARDATIEKQRLEREELRGDLAEVKQRLSVESS
jgi:hypothetical protein